MKNVINDKTYYSQFGEDRILAEIFNKKATGLCIEVGANDGVNDSTTMYFEKLGWNCILVEPNPILCKLIRSFRNSTLIEAAASNENGKTSLFVAEGSERAHGVSTIDSTDVALNKIKSYGFTYNEVQVETTTVNEILDNLKIDRAIDFVSVDVEGHELKVLEGFSLERWKPVVILVEDNSNYINADVSNYLKTFGYLRFMRTGVNDWYAHKTNKQLVNFYSRSRYNWVAYKAIAKNNLRKIPGVLRIKRFLTN
ncbi:MAG: FkbM family methyltransferase [Cytophaga sp.]|nr:FkbM family methyltransferase [Undibacterium sp.]